MKRLFAGILFSAVAAFVAMPSVGWAKSAKDCEAEWKENKDALKADGQKKKDFVPACRADQEKIPKTVTAPPPEPKKAEPIPAQKETVAPPPATKKEVTAPARVAPSTTGTPTKANEFTAEAQAKAKCPSDTVVWVNTKSSIYHFAGTRDYGTTKRGAYMCEADTAANGYRAAKNEKHP
jgi:outer membrane biosynthesis protein TonB